MLKKYSKFSYPNSHFCIKNSVILLTVYSKSSSHSSSDILAFLNKISDGSDLDRIQQIMELVKIF